MNADDNALGGSDITSDSAAWSSILAHIRAAEGTLKNPWVLYGGGSFTPSAFHPGIELVGPDGRPTSAAGPYQAEKATWHDWAKKQPQTPNFSDLGTQNQFAQDLATEAYKRNTGRDILSDFKSSSGLDWSALAGTWTGLAGMKAGGALGSAVAAEGSPALSAPFVPPVVNFNGVGGAPAAAAATSSAPVDSSLAANPLLALALAAPHFQFIPVKYNPFVGETSMSGAREQVQPTAPAVPRFSTAGAASPASAGNIASVGSGVVVPSPLRQRDTGENYLLGPLLHPEN